MKASHTPYLLFRGEPKRASTVAQHNPTTVVGWTSKGVCFFLLSPGIHTSHILEQQLRDASGMITLDKPQGHITNDLVPTIIPNGYTPPPPYKPRPCPSKGP